MSSETEEYIPGLADAAEAIERGSRFAKLRKGCLVAVFTLALLTLGLEITLRATGDRERQFARSVNKTNARWVALTQAGIFEEVSDPVRRYAMRPLAEAEVEGWSFRVSSHRSRGPDFPSAKPPGEKRLLALGDSFCFGLWSDEDETLVGHLARLANEAEQAAGSDTRWRAINLGVPGYHSGQQLIAFEEEGLALDPDVVVLYFNTNDIEQEGFFFDDELGVLRRDFLPLPTRLRKALWSSHLYGWITRFHRRMVESGERPHFEQNVPYAHVRADNQRATAAALARIAELCREREIPLFFVNQPLMSWSEDARSAAWDVLELVDWAEEQRRELGLPGVNLLGWMRGYADGVDRFEATPESAPERDFLVEQYFADERVQEAFRFAQERAREVFGKQWPELAYSEQVQCFAGYQTELPKEPDFHLTGAGYGHIARVVYPHMQAAGLLP